MRESATKRADLRSVRTRGRGARGQLHGYHDRLAEAALDRLGDEVDLALTRSEGPGAEVVALMPWCRSWRGTTRCPRSPSMRFRDWFSARSGTGHRLVATRCRSSLSCPCRAVGRDLLTTAFPGDWIGALSVADPATLSAPRSLRAGLHPAVRGGAARAVPLEGPCGFPKIATAETLKTEEYPLDLAGLSASARAPLAAGRARVLRVHPRRPPHRTRWPRPASSTSRSTGRALRRAGRSSVRRRPLRRGCRRTGRGPADGDGSSRS